MTVQELRDLGKMRSIGLAGSGRQDIAALVVPAWDDFLEIVESVDLAAPTRLKGWRAQEVAVHLGVWPGYRALDLLLESARSGAQRSPDVDSSNARVTTEHAGASRAEVIRALKKHRDDIRRFGDAPADPALDLAPTASLVGTLPLLTVILGEAYELAVHGLDLAAAGGIEPSQRLLSTGIAALADVTGALAASVGIEGRVTLQVPEGGWAFTTTGDGWTTTRAHGAGRRPTGPAVSGPAALVLDASAGRANPVVQLARRRLLVHDLPGLLRLAPLLEVAPNIPGGPMLALAARTLSGATSFLGRRMPFQR
jgi:uncharacterized protein (TIGR03083 family)